MADVDKKKVHSSDAAEKEKKSHSSEKKSHSSDTGEKKEREKKESSKKSNGEKKESSSRSKKSSDPERKKKKSSKESGEKKESSKKKSSDPEKKKKKSSDPDKKKKEKTSTSSSSASKKESTATPKKGRVLGDINDDFDVKEELGRGAFSVVKLAVEKKTGEKYAVKVIDKKSVGQDMDRLETEIDILKKVNHPNVIALKALYDTKDVFYIVTELVTGGELFDKIVELGNYTERDAAVLVQKMLSAIAYLHDLDIVHRDLKPENLLLKDSSSISEVKLADFGLSKIVSQQVMMQTACGTPGYVAPEVLKASGYGPEVDLWSIGVITYILLCGFPPFYHEELPELFEQIMKAEYDFPEEYWDSVSDAAKDFIKNLLVVEPKDRMTTKQALNHKWITGAAPAKELSGAFNEKLKKYVHVRKAESKVLAGSLQF